MIGYMDYIFFVYGFSFLLLGVVLLRWARVAEGRLPWAWLAWFGLLHGTNEWLDMLTISLGDSSAFKVVRLAIMAASFLPLVEFGRRGLKEQGTHAPGRWIYAPLIALASLGGLEGMDGLNATCRYALGLPAGLLAGSVLLREARRMDTGRRFPLGLMGLAFLVYGQATGLIVPRAAFFPASILNHDAFLATAGFPIQIIRTLSAAAAALGVWLVYWHPIDQANRAGWFRRWLIPGAAVALLAGGFVPANWSGQRAEAEIRDHLLSQARAIARMIDINRVKALSFTAADKTNPYFQRLCGQMTAYARGMNLNSIYSMTVRDGAIFFGPKNLAKNDLPDWLPGTVYKEPPAELCEVFQNHRSLTAGPFKNEYGTFISAFAPVFDPLTDEVLLVIGMDIEAESWQATIARARLVHLLFTLVLIVILLAGSGVLRWREGLPGDKQWRLRHAEAFLTGAIGLVLTVVAAHQDHDNEMRHRQTRFSQLAEPRVGSVVEALRLIRDDQLAPLARFFDSTQKMTQQEFHTYASLLARTPVVEAWLWVPFVAAHEKEKVEVEAHRDGLAGFAIHREDARGGRTPATGRDAYYPVFYVEPLSGNAGALGYDLGSEPARRAALEEAARIGLPTVTGPVTLRVGSATKEGVLVFHPIFVKEAKADKAANRNAKPGRLRGFVVAVLRLELMLNKAMAQYVHEQPFVYVELYQTKAVGASLCLASSSPEAFSRPGPESEFPIRAASGLSATFPLFAFGEAYAVVVHAGPAFLAANPGRAGWVVILAELLLTAVMTVFVGFLSNRRAGLESQVRARTAELRESEETARLMAQENAVIADIGRIISSTLEIEEVHERFAAETRKLISFDRIAVSLNNPEETTATVAYASGLELEGRKIGDVYPLHHTSNEEVVRTRAGLLVQPEAVEELEGRFPILIPTFQAGLRSMISVPLISRDRVIGALHLRSKRSKAYTDRDLGLAGRIANQIAGAIANAQLFLERKQAEEERGEALRRAAWLARFPEENPSPVVRVSAEGSVLYRNRPAGELSGWACEVGKPLPDPLLPLVGLAITEEQEAQQEVEIGGRFYSVAVMPFLKESYANIYGRDITERKRTDEALRESEKRYRQVIENAAEIIYTTDAKGNFTYGNPAGLKITGYALEELRRLNYLDLIMPEHRQRVMDMYITQFRERQATTYLEFAFRSKSGEVLWLGQNASLVTEGGRVGGFHIIARDITERKAAETALREQRQLLDNILNSIPTPVFYKDLKGTYLGCNSAFLDYIGLPRETVIGKPISEIVPAEQAKIYLKTDQDVINTGGSQVYETGFPHADGSVREVMIHKAVFRSMEGAIAGIVGAIFDITDRKQTEELYRTLTDNSQMGIYIIQDGKFRFVNHRFREYFQYGPHESVDFDLRNIVHPEDREKARENAINMLKGKLSSSYEYRIKDKNGQIRWLLERSAPMSYGGKRAVLANAIDITELKQAEESIKNTKEFYETIINSMKEALSIIDVKDFKIVDGNKAFLDRLGMKKEEVIGKRCYEITHELSGPCDSPEHVCPIMGALKTGISSVAEHVHYAKDGTKRHVEVSASPIRNERGEIIQVVHVDKDITERKNLEGQLAQAQKLEAVGQLAAGIAHEINTPTQYVGDNTRFFNEAFNDLLRLMGKYDQLSQMIKTGAPLDGVLQEIEGIAKEIDLAYLTDEIPKAIRQTLEGVERVRIIVQAMKEFSHPGTKEKTPVNLNKAIQNTITVARNEWKYVAEMATEFDSSLPLVSCLPGELNQVILNMIINAAHAIADVVGDGSKGKGTITVSTRHDGNWAEIRVRDTGTGIPENIRSRIFDPFFTTKKVGKGTGQGLAISHSVIVDKHGGTIHFDTEMGKGTTFIIRLPIDGAGL